MMWVKICGITNLDDARVALDAGADALGFVFYPKSPRYITPKDAALITAQLPSHIKKIALFVDENAKEINAICQQADMDVAQLHFDADEALIEALKVPFLRVVRAQIREDIERFRGELRLVDAHVPSFGGAGQRLDLSWFSSSDNENIILAGGLSPDNVDEIKTLGFYGVDVSSGVEKAKGLKDHAKVRAFVAKAKA